MPEEYVCQDCGCTQETKSDGEVCPWCGGKFVNLNEDLADYEDQFQDNVDSGEDDFGFSEG